MALTNSLLKQLGIESEQRDTIMAAHQETLDSIKRERDELRDMAAKVPDLEGQIEALKAADESDEWKARYGQAKAEADKAKADAERLQGEVESLKAARDELQGEFDAYKGDVATERADAEKLELYKAVLREIGLDEKRVEKAARVKDLSELAVEDGALAGRDELLKAEAEEWAEFIPRKSLQVPQFAKPQKAEPTEDGPDEAIASALKARHERLYGKAVGNTDE